MKKYTEKDGKFFDQDGDEIEEIKICYNHEDYEVPLIWTFAFNGSEYWCPFCGSNQGMMGAGEDVPVTKELLERHNQFEKHYEPFLDARSTLICSSLIWKGKKITPGELPKKEIKRCRDLANDGWQEEKKIEDLLKG